MVRFRLRKERKDKKLTGLVAACQGTMSPPTAKFNVGGTVFEVTVSTIESQPDGLLARMIDGRFGDGKDESGAYFIDRSPRFFEVVLDVHRDNKVYPLSPGMTRERVVAELEFYGLQDFFEAGAPIGLSVESTVRSVMDAQQTLQKASDEFSQWQREQERLGYDLLDEGFARLFLANAELPKAQGPTSLQMHPLELNTLQGFRAIPRGNTLNPTSQTNMHIVKFFEDWGTKATIDGNSYHPKIKLGPDEPGAGT